MGHLYLGRRVRKGERGGHLHQRCCGGEEEGREGEEDKGREGEEDKGREGKEDKGRVGEEGREGK